ncbi:hypothetical protein LEMLEM_LOCUS16769, partial [Lemmus lemmus]
MLRQRLQVLAEDGSGQPQERPFTSDHKSDLVLRLHLRLCLQTSSSDCNCLHQTSDCNELLSPPTLFSSLC